MGAPSGGKGDHLHSDHSKLLSGSTRNQLVYVRTRPLVLLIINSVEAVAAEKYSLRP